MKRCEVEARISNALGLHLRAAAAFAKLAEGFESEISVLRDSARANGKSIISLVTLAAAPGTRIRIIAEGEDAEAAVEALAGLVAKNFGEDQP